VAGKCRAMLVDTHDRGINGRNPVQVTERLGPGLDVFEHPRPITVFGPTVKVLEHRVPVPEALGKVPPRRPGPELPCRPFYDNPAVCNRATIAPRRKKGPNQAHTP
jgi:hypothetical protein